MATKRKRKRVVPNDGEHLFADLVRAIDESGYRSDDDDTTTTGGTMQTAIYVIDRMKDDLVARRTQHEHD